MPDKFIAADANVQMKRWSAGVLAREGAMAWTLKICHFDVAGSGDSTLIMAKNDDAKDAKGNKITLTRSVLIDGGKSNAGELPAALKDNLTTQKMPPTVDVMICTHYDLDHVFGLTQLLNGTDSMFKNTIVFDQGYIGEMENELLTNFRDAVGKRTRPTEQVNRLDIENAPLQPAGWLIGREVMWWGSNVPTGFPQLTCVAANGYVIQKGQRLKNGEPPRTKLVSSGYDKLDPNEWSLAFLLTFGNFRYYAGGDLTSVQESGDRWDSKLKAYKDIVDPTEDKKGMINYPGLSLMQFLGGVDAMKTSHHGSKESSSPNFINTLQPRAAFISCGTNNMFCHPHQQVVDALENCTTLQDYFLTGFFTPGFTSNKYQIPWIGKKANVAGVWITKTQSYDIEKEGDVVLSIDENGAQARPAKFDVHYYMPKRLLTPPPQDPKVNPEEYLQTQQMGNDDKDTHWQTKNFA